MPRAGELRERLIFQSPAPLDDGYGNQEQGWQDEFTAWARLQPKVGGETVLAARLTGRQIYLVHLRSSGNTRRVAPEWQAVHVKNGRVFQIKSPSRNMDEKGDWLEMDAEELIIAPDVEP